MKRDDLRITPAALSALAGGDAENFIAALTPGGIERQEAEGQQRLIRSAVLPKEFNSGTREELEAAGVVFGTDADALFVNVTLPEGWRKEATDHSMWSKLLDDKGRERAAIFYKAAFYDRKAHVDVSRRFNVSGYSPCDAGGSPTEHGQNTHLATVVTDGGKIVHVAGIRPDGPEGRGMREAHSETANAWLDEHYPEWQSRAAYWD